MPIPVRTLGWVAYLSVLGAVGLTWVWQSQSAANPPHAAPRPELFVDPDTDPVLGRLLRSRVTEDAPMKPASQPSPRPIPDATLMIGKAFQQRLNLGKGTLIQVQQAQKPLVAHATVQATACDETNCSVILDLAQAPPELRTSPPHRRHHHPGQRQRVK